MAQKIFDKGNSFYVCYSVTYLDLNGVYFIFNYSLLVKRTSRPDGYRPDCKCSENLYLTVEVTTTLSLAFHNILCQKNCKIPIVNGSVGCSGRICVIVIWKACPA